MLAMQVSQWGNASSLEKVHGGRRSPRGRVPPHFKHWFNIPQIDSYLNVAVDVAITVQYIMI